MLIDLLETLMESPIALVIALLAFTGAGYGFGARVPARARTAATLLLAAGAIGLLIVFGDVRTALREDTLGANIAAFVAALALLGGAVGVAARQNDNERGGKP